MVVKEKTRLDYAVPDYVLPPWRNSDKFYALGIIFCYSRDPCELNVFKEIRIIDASARTNKGAASVGV